MEKLKCESCGANLEIDENKEYATCKYCNLKYKLKNKDFIYYIYSNTYRKIYKFLWRGHNLFFGVLLLKWKESVQNEARIKSHIRNIN